MEIIVKARQTAGIKPIGEGLEITLTSWFTFS
jgi:hypothetical protein